MRVRSLAACDHRLTHVSLGAAEVPWINAWIKLNGRSRVSQPIARLHHAKDVPRVICHQGTAGSVHKTKCGSVQLSRLRQASGRNLEECDL